MDNLPPTNWYKLGNKRKRRAPITIKIPFTIRCNLYEYIKLSTIIDHSSKLSKADRNFLMEKGPIDSYD